MRSKPYLLILILVVILLAGCSEKPTGVIGDKKVLIFVRDGSKYPEYMGTHEVGVMRSMLEEAGILAVVATQSEDSYQGYESLLKSDILLHDVNVSDYDGFLLPCMAAGTRAPIIEDAVAMVIEAAAQNKPIAAQDGTVPILAEAGLLDGKRYGYRRVGFWEGTFEGTGAIQDGIIITSGTCPHAARYYERPDSTPELTQLLINAIGP
jgi:putative intracellular protease/amidase